MATGPTDHAPTSIWAQLLLVRLEHRGEATSGRTRGVGVVWAGLGPARKRNPSRPFVTVGSLEIYAPLYLSLPTSPP